MTKSKIGYYLNVTTPIKCKLFSKGNNEYDGGSGGSGNDNDNNCFENDDGNGGGGIDEDDHDGNDQNGGGDRYLVGILISSHCISHQISYTYEVDQATITLYVVAPNEVVRDSWITAIRTEAAKHDAPLQEYYHRGVLVEGVYNCCGRKADMEGCQKASQHAAGKWGFRLCEK
ncbi:hypothetical protein ElyMa_002087200 [Elysia marginata]|uniref:PH domain-containing protein n=1 Tax=Elysia marginata TaxID=1093978 RepID=A0AAV4FFD0_9GAST|nr:hypothetical protein ElyMa_002087200 [Elysia marginata]